MTEAATFPPEALQIGLFYVVLFALGFNSNV